MSRGGARPGAGRKSGGTNRAKLQLEVAAEAGGKKPTPAQRHKALRRQVALCVADDMDESAIAVVMMLPVERLRQLFARELQHGREIVRAVMLARLDALSEGGNVAASKAVLAAAEGDAEPKRDGHGHAPGSLAARALTIINGGKADER